MSDFIFVKEGRLQEALALFSAAGFSLYSPNSAPSSPTPAVLTRANSPSGVRTEAEATPRSKSHSPHAGQVHVLNSDLTCVVIEDLIEFLLLHLMIVLGTTGRCYRTVVS